MIITAFMAFSPMSTITRVRNPHSIIKTPVAISPGLHSYRHDQPIIIAISTIRAIIMMTPVREPPAARIKPHRNHLREVHNAENHGGEREPAGPCTRQSCGSDHDEVSMKCVRSWC